MHNAILFNLNSQTFNIATGLSLRNTLKWHKLYKFLTFRTAHILLLFALCIHNVITIFRCAYIITLYHIMYTPLNLHSGCTCPSMQCYAVKFHSFYYHPPIQLLYCYDSIIHMYMEVPHRYIWNLLTLLVYTTFKSVFSLLCY